MIRAALPVVVLFFLILTACSGTPPSRFYLLDAGPPNTALVDGPAIFVDQAKIAAYADRSPIVLRRGETEVAFSEFEAWAEPIGGQITAVIADALGDQFGRANVRPTPGRRGRDPDFRVGVEVLRFEIEKDNSAMLDARWTLFGGPEDEFVASGRERLTSIPRVADSYDARVAALSRTLVELAGSIADAIDLDRAQ